jgi:hypothetical protein
MSNEVKSMKNLYILLLLTLSSCSGTPSVNSNSGVGGNFSDSGTPTGGSPGTGGASAVVCNTPSWAGSVGALPQSVPNATPPGYIVAVIANGSSALQVTYQPSTGTATTVSISAGNNSGITFTGSWSKDGQITSVTTGKGWFAINSSTFTVSGATVSGSGSWSGINAGVGQITGQGNTLTFAGYNANSGIQQAPLQFTGTCN